jgi:hypothetical protein
MKAYLALIGLYLFLAVILILLPKEKESDIKDRIEIYESECLFNDIRDEWDIGDTVIDGMYTYPDTVTTNFYINPDFKHGVFGGRHNKLRTDIKTIGL